MLVGLPRLVIICRTQGRCAHLLVADLTLQAPAGDAAKGEHWAAAATGCWQPPWECRPCSRWRAIAMHQGCCGVSEGLRSGGQQWPGGAGSSNPCASPLPAARSAGGWHQGAASDHSDGRQQALDRRRRPPCRCRHRRRQARESLFLTPYCCGCFSPSCPSLPTHCCRRQDLQDKV
jgi:hypothetical protein